MVIAFQGGPAVRNPASWYSENPQLDRALEHAAELRNDWATANRRRPGAATAAGPNGVGGHSHGIRLAIGLAAVAIGRAIGGSALAEEECDAEASDALPRAA